MERMPNDKNKNKNGFRSRFSSSVFVFVLSDTI